MGQSSIVICLVNNFIHSICLFLALFIIKNKQTAKSTLKSMSLVCLLGEGALASIKDMLQFDQVPSHLAITRLVQGLGSHGDLEGIQEVENIVKTLGTSVSLSYMLFMNNKALAHIKK